MNLNRYLLLWLVAVTLLSHPSQSVAQQTTAFTYQGQLRDGGTNANGTYAMTFKLYDAVSGGGQIGSPVSTSPALANGLFTVNLDFGAGAFNGSARWLDITVAGETLTPRVQVLPAPYAQFAAVAATVTNGAIMNAQLATNSIATVNIQNGAITDSRIAATTTLVRGAENNFRIIRGVLRGDNGTIVAGSGFTATLYPPGTGGTNIGDFNVQIVGTDYELSFAGFNSAVVHPYDWLLAGNQLFHVQSVGITSIRLYGTGCGLPVGGNVSVSLKPRLASEWNITFTPPFSSIPAIALSSHGEDAFSSGTSHPAVRLKRSENDGGATFRAIIGYNYLPNANDSGNGFPAGCPPYGNGFEFIAIGPQ